MLGFLSDSFKLLRQKTSNFKSYNKLNLTLGVISYNKFRNSSPEGLFHKFEMATCLRSPGHLCKILIFIINEHIIPLMR